MRKRLFIIGSLIAFLFNLSACNSRSTDAFSVSDTAAITAVTGKDLKVVTDITQPLIPDITVTPIISAIPIVTSMPEATLVPELSSASGVTAAPGITPILASPASVSEEVTSQTYKVVSNSGKLTATAYTTSESSDFNEVIDKITIRTEDNIYELSDIIGYYDRMQWSDDDTKLAISYYGRQWGNFIIIDIVNNRIVFPEMYYDDIRKHFEDLGYNFDYEPNASRPDPYIYFDGWSEDSQSFKIRYTVKDIDWQTQSGSFWYDLDTGEMRDFEQYLPYQQG